MLKAVAGTRGHFVHTYKEKPKGTAEDRVHTLGSSSSDTRAERQKHDANLRETPGSGHSSPPAGGMRSSRASNASSPFLFSLQWASGVMISSPTPHSSTDNDWPPSPAQHCVGGHTVGRAAGWPGRHWACHLQREYLVAQENPNSQKTQ